MVAVKDILVSCANCSSTVERDVTYAVKNNDGSSVRQISICESPNVSNWSCDQNMPGLSNIGCGQNQALNVTDSDGEFEDSWTLEQDGFTPSGCGLNITDVWVWDRSPNSNPSFGRLTGFVHNTNVMVNGSTTPPETQALPAGTCINSQGTVSCPH